ncbi:MAG: hypothetical protein LLG06_15865 [Desulfobacteraceae bacterium]|nr:hypothetical protein [Desulfobacteraceae bacterium]
MNSDEIFDILPLKVLRGFKTRMLLGTVPADTVAEVLEPFLSRFFDLMLGLPPGLQTDMENILRIYPDVAERFGLRMKPPMETVLTELRLHFTERGDLEEEYAPDMAAEDQAPFWGSTSRLWEAQGFFRTDRDNPVYLELSYRQADAAVRFAHISTIPGIEIVICGAPVLSLGRDVPKGEVPVGVISSLLANLPSHPLIRIIEKSGNSPRMRIVRPESPTGM